MLRPETIKLLEEHIGRTLDDINQSKILYDLPLVAPAAKSLQSCPTLCDPRDSSPPGSSVPGVMEIKTKAGRKPEILLLLIRSQGIIRCRW